MYFSQLQSLKNLLSAAKEEVNEVEKREPGYGAIHYIAKGKHRYKTELLVTLAIHGNANLDLATTHRDQMTALHLAVEPEVCTYSARLRPWFCNILSTKLVLHLV